jgi:hypothetical protein
VILADNDDVAGLRTFGTLFDGELDALAFFEVAITITLDGREVDEDIRSTFALDKAVALATVEPFDRTDDTFRHFINLLVEIKKLVVDQVLGLFHRNGQIKKPMDNPRAAVLTSNVNFLVSYILDNTLIIHLCQDLI